LNAPRYKVSEDEMLDAACRVFAAEGFERANMDAIAASAGTTKPTLYARFGTKQSLFEAAVHREYKLLKDRLFETYAVRAEEPFRARLARWNNAYFEFVRERPDGFRLSLEGERHEAAAIIDRANAEIVERIAELVVQISSRRAEQGGRMIGSMICGVVTWCARAAIEQGVPLERAAELSESFLYAGLRGLDPELLDLVGTRG
jgi:AcrR family transcriptional regulator